PPAPEGGLIDHVVVDEGRGVEQLDHTAESHRARALVAGQAGRHEEQDGPQPLAASPRDELAHLADEVHRRVDLVADLGLDGGELAADHERDALLQQRLEGGGGFHAGARRGRGQRRRTRSRILICAPSLALWTSTTENLSRTSVTLPVATSSSSSPRSSPVMGCTMGILSRRRLTTLPGLTPSRAVRSMTMRVVSTKT